VINRLKLVQRVSVGLLAISLPISMAATNFAWSLAALVFLIRLLTDPASRRFRWTGLEFPWLLFFGATVLSCAFAADPARGFRKLPTELLAIVFVLGAQAQDREDAERNLSVFLLASAYIGLWGLLQYGLGIVKEGGQYIVPEWAAFLPKGMIKELVTARGRAVGHFSHPLTYANVLLLSAPIFLGLALKSWGMARRNAPVAAELRDSHPIPSWSYWTGFFLVFLGLFASGSRMAAASLLFTLLVWTWLERRRALAGAAAGILLAVILGAVFAPGLRERFSFSTISTDPSVQLRFDIWRSSFQAFLENPAFGSGPGNFRITTDPIPGALEKTVTWSEAHNIFLQMAAERGLLGLSAFLFLIWRILRLLLSPWRGDAQPVAGRDLFAIRYSPFFLSVLALLLAGLTESWTHDSEVMMALFFLLGTAAALRQESAPFKDILQARAEK
jgi:O-antigen ligase